MRTYEFCTRNPIEFQRWTKILDSQNIKWYSAKGKGKFRGLYYIFFQAKESNLPFDFHALMGEQHAIFLH